MRAVILVALLVGCSEDTATMDEPDAAPMPGEIEGWYSIRVTSYGLPQDPCLCGDWSEADEYETMTVAKDGDGWIVIFDSVPSYYRDSLSGTAADEFTIDLPALSWDGGRTDPIRLNFTAAGAVSSEFVFYRDDLGTSYPKRLTGNR